MSPRIFNVGGKPVRELDDTMIEEREAPLDGVRHRDPVALGIQQITGQQRVRLDVLIAAHRQVLRDLLGQAFDHVRSRIALTEHRTSFGREELPAPSRRRPAWAMRERRQMRVAQPWP